MKNFKLGAMLESFKLPLAEALAAARGIEADGVQIFATDNGFAPYKSMTSDKKKELLSMLDANGLEISAICADFGHGFGNPELNADLIDKSKRVMYLAKELGTDIVTTHIGVVPTDKNHPRYEIMQKACLELANFADSIGSHFAVETGPETSTNLKAFLDSLGSRGVAVNLDPANLVMVTADDPVQAVYTLKDYIVHTHAKDGVRLVECDPEIVYRVTHPIPAEFVNVRTFKEMPLGQGNVPFKDYLNALKDIGYNGYLTIEREVGENPLADIQLAASFLKEKEM